MRILHPGTWFGPPRGQRLHVDAGRVVGCPVRGEADIESCFACGHMLNLAGGSRARVVCGYPRGDLLASFVRRSG